MSKLWKAGLEELKCLETFRQGKKRKTRSWFNFLKIDTVFVMSFIFSPDLYFYSQFALLIY